LFEAVPLAELPAAPAPTATWKRPIAEAAVKHVSVGAGVITGGAVAVKANEGAGLVWLMLFDPVFKPVTVMLLLGTRGLVSLDTESPVMVDATVSGVVPGIVLLVNVTGNAGRILDVGTTLRMFPTVMVTVRTRGEAAPPEGVNVICPL